MKKIGLTGSIAVGKTFVAQIFAELGAYVSDADQIARDVVAGGSQGLAEVSAAFGKQILNEDGTLNRALLGEIVFRDERRREQLNAILHPRIIAAQDDWINRIYQTDKNALIIVDAALMIESESFTRFDRIVVVWCEDEIQIKRLMKRNNLSQTQAETRIAAQLSQNEKKKYADYLIDTSRGFEDTRRQTVEVYQQLVSENI